MVSDVYQGNRKILLHSTPRTTKKSRLFALIQAENKQEMSESYGNQGLKQAGHNFAKTYMTSHYNLKTTSVRFQKIFFQGPRRH